MKRRKTAIDPITIEIISNGLRSIADETFVALMKSVGTHLRKGAFSFLKLSTC